jgi:hypothetical protein
VRVYHGPRAIPLEHEAMEVAMLHTQAPPGDVSVTFRLGRWSEGV